MMFVKERITKMEMLDHLATVSECRRLRSILRERDREIERLTTALKNLIENSGHVSPFGGSASVAAVRKAGKYIEAFEAAQAVIDDPR
jgi:hypothetical protein